MSIESEPKKNRVTIQQNKETQTDETDRIIIILNPATEYKHTQKEQVLQILRNWLDIDIENKSEDQKTEKYFEEIRRIREKRIRDEQEARQKANEHIFKRPATPKK
jgi:hypothetical protein